MLYKRGFAPTFGGLIPPPRLGVIDPLGEAADMLRRFETVVGNAWFDSKPITLHSGAACCWLAAPSC